VEPVLQNKTGNKDLGDISEDSVLEAQLPVATVDFENQSFIQ
jgi:hypothetical protein